MQEKQNPEKKPGTDIPETGKQGGQGDVGKKGGDVSQPGKTGGDLGHTGDVGKQGQGR